MATRRTTARKKALLSWKKISGFIFPTIFWNFFSHWRCLPLQMWWWFLLHVPVSDQMRWSQRVSSLYEKITVNGANKYIVITDTKNYHLLTGWTRVTKAKNIHFRISDDNEGVREITVKSLQASWALLLYNFTFGILGEYKWDHCKFNFPTIFYQFEIGNFAVKNIENISFAKDNSHIPPFLDPRSESRQSG